MGLQFRNGFRMFDTKPGCEKEYLIGGRMIIRVACRLTSRCTCRFFEVEHVERAIFGVARTLCWDSSYFFNARRCLSTDGKYV